LEQLGRLPKENEVVKINDLIITIEEVTESRIMCLLVHGVKKEEEKSGDSTPQTEKEK
ncbi:MAG: hypothetical protein JSV04_08960, partial [Candidatus Heimdallarchaeota archaeon]